ncbi:MAG: hypothetical protein P4L69_06175 [Desulfosporosinus sp.]|nr:hypothetical protein [Desulfosporosinus sp.]
MYTKDQFEKYFCKIIGITIDKYRERFVTLPCDCQDDDCTGWACVANNELSIKVHNNRYNGGDHV